jgi:carbonic anhydrase
LDPAHFYTYQGSLTTPPCNEIVVWTVFAKVLAINVDEVNLIFKHLF